MFKWLSSDVKESEKLSRELGEYDGKQKAQLETAIKEADQKILETKGAFDEGKLLQKANVLDLFKEFELAQIRKLQISQGFIDGKEKIANQLRAFTIPVIASYCQDLLKEVAHIEGLKKFEIVRDGEDPRSNKAGSRTFIANHNYFKCHSAMKEISAGIDTLKNSELESLVKIKEKYTSIVEAIPSSFEFETTEGNERLREFFFENKPRKTNPDEIAHSWLDIVRIQADLLKQSATFEYWGRQKRTNSKQDRPIVDLT